MCQSFSIPKEAKKDPWKEKKIYDGARAEGKTIDEASKIAGITSKQAKEYEQWCEMYMDDKAAWGMVCLTRGMPVEKHAVKESKG